MNYSNIIENNEFPLLKSFDYHDFFKNQIVFFYFNLSKKTDTKNVLELSNKLSDVLKILKTQLVDIKDGNNKYLPYLVLFYRMIGQTRDIYIGKGEHDISYMFLMVFYDVFPTLAIFAMYRFVQPTDDFEIPFGCWRDIKYLSGYIRKNSPQKENHGLIWSCIGLMNLQLKRDIEIIDGFDSSSQKSISNVSKWVPREYKRFHWLYNMLVIDWSKMHLNYLYNDNIHSKSMLKAKMVYRREISALNNAIDTTEIKQCSQNWDFINPEKVPCYTLMKQRCLLFGNSEKYSGCSNKIREHLNEKQQKNSQNIGRSKFSKNGNHRNIISYPVGFFVKEAMRILNNSDMVSQKDILNKQWQMFSKTIGSNGFDNVLPILDSSYYMQLNDSESFYAAIGFAILIAERTTFGKRILMVDYQSTWVNFDSSFEFIDIVENIQNCIVSKTNTLFDIGTAMELIVYSLLQSKSNNRYIKNMKLIFLSCFHGIDSMQPFVNMFSKYELSLPIFIFWNLSKQEIIPSFYETDSVYIISGMFNGGINVLYDSLMFIKNKKNNIKNGYSVFDHVSFILNNKRYDILEKYCYSFFDSS